MIKETLKNGFEVEIPDENLDDYELLEDLAALDEGEENTAPTRDCWAQNSTRR